MFLSRYTLNAKRKCDISCAQQKNFNKNLSLFKAFMNHFNLNSKIVANQTHPKILIKPGRKKELCCSSSCSDLPLGKLCTV